MVVTCADFIKYFEKNHQIHLTAVNVSYNIKIAQTAHKDYLQSAMIVRKQVGIFAVRSGKHPLNKQEH